MLPPSPTRLTRGHHHHERCRCYLPACALMSGYKEKQSKTERESCNRKKRVQLPVLHHTTAVKCRVMKPCLAIPRRATWCGYHDTEICGTVSGHFYKCDKDRKELKERTADIREILPGFLRGDTPAPGLSESQCRHLLGQCTDIKISCPGLCTSWHRPVHTSPPAPEQ